MKGKEREGKEGGPCPNCKFKIMPMDIRVMPIFVGGPLDKGYQMIPL